MYGETQRSDYYLQFEEFSEDERNRLQQLRSFLEINVRPHVDKLWANAEFPHEVVAPLAELGVFGLQFEESRSFEASTLFRGWIAHELARVDTSLATFYGVHSEIGIGVIGHCGSTEQRLKWLPKMAAGEVISAVAITEPQSGSDAARGLETTATQVEGGWVLNGKKRWIGNGTWADICIVFAKDVADNQVKGFIVPTDTDGYTATKIEDKASLRIVQNADIDLQNVFVSDENKLERANSFADVSRVLRHTRSLNGWFATGLQAGAYEAALDYAQERAQFGRHIAGFQLVQDLLVKSLGNLTASLAMMVRLAQLTDKGVEIDSKAALAKAYTSSRARETAGWCREVFGGNGLDLSYSIMRFFADAEAVHTYEGTREINTLIVGRDVTGVSAFV